MKAMTLAAGGGERLRPLTDALPKALVEAGGRPLIACPPEGRAASGCREVVINVSHLAERIVERIGDGARYGLRIAYSREPQPLETAGGLAQARALLGDEPFLLVNSDVYCEVEFEKLLRHSLAGRLGHLVLVANPPYHPAGDFTLDHGLIGNGAGPRYTYAGVAGILPGAFPPGKAGGRAAPPPL